MATTARKALLRSLAVYHGKAGGDGSVEVDLAEGPTTQLSIGELADGRLRFIPSEGAVPRPHVRTGTVASWLESGCNPADWCDAWSMSGSTHQWSIGMGHRPEEPRVLANLLGIEYHLVQPS